MSSECCRSKWARERDRKGWRKLLYPLTQKRVITALRLGVSGQSLELREVRRIRENLRDSGLPRSAPKKLTP
jgi:hypothetical protein